MTKEDAKFFITREILTKQAMLVRADDTSDDKRTEEYKKIRNDYINLIAGDNEKMSEQLIEIVVKAEIYGEATGIDLAVDCCIDFLLSYGFIKE